MNFYTDRVAHSRELVVAMLSHDLRSPLQGIALATELSLHMGQLNERQTMLSKKVLESTQRMGALINDLLDVTRARFGAGLPVVRAMMNMATVAEQIVDEVRVVHPRRAIELSVSGLMVGEWDKARIGQVFSNLLNNAMQYGSYSAPVRVGLTGDPSAVTVTVANDGVTIPPDKIRMIFRSAQTSGGRRWCSDVRKSRARALHHQGGRGGARRHHRSNILRDGGHDLHRSVSAFAS